MPRLSVYEVRDTIIDRMVNNVYPVGAKLPTARELASELGVHRNTASKAYNLLAELGLVASKPGKGTFAVAVMDDHWQFGLSRQLDAGIEAVLSAARRLGFAEDDLRGLLDEKVAHAYRQPACRGVFVECNLADVNAALAEVEASTQIRLDGMLIEALQREPEIVASQYDAVVTNLIHIKEVTDCLESVHEDIQIIGIYTQADENALMEIACIPPGSIVGVVVDSPEGAHRFTNQITTFNPIHVKVTIDQSNDAIRELAREVELLVCSRSREDQIRRLDLPLKTVPLPFHVSRQSALRVLDALSDVPVHLAAPPQPALAGNGRVASNR